MSRFTEASTKRRKRAFAVYVGFLFLWSASFLLMPFANGATSNPTFLLYVAGILFWLGIIGTAISALCINHRRKKSRSFMEQQGRRRQIGLIHFFQNHPAKIADIALVASTLGLVIASLWIKPSFITFLFLALFVFSFGMHCMLNGINYVFIKFSKERKNNECN